MRYGRLILSLGIGIGLLYLSLKGLDLQGAAASVRKADRLLLGGGLGLVVVSYLLRGRRWVIWEKGLKFGESFRIILVGFMGNNILPARLGEILRAHCAAARIENAHGRTASLASVAIERVLDGWVISMIGLAGLALFPLSWPLRAALGVVCLLFFIAAGGLVASLRFHRQVRDLADKAHRIFPGHLTRFGKEKVHYFLDGLMPLRNGRTFLLAFLATTAVWVTELFSYFLIGRAVFPGMEFSICLIFLPVVNFASLFPFTVGGIGSIEGATIPYLLALGIPAPETLAMVVLQHGFQLLFTTSLGLLFFYAYRYWKISLVDPKGKRLPEPERDTEKSLRLQDFARTLGLDPASGERSISLSVVVPAFNEKNRLPRTILETIRWCRENTPSYEILIVDDGSSDETFELGRLFGEYDPNVIALANPHLGKGAAVRTGMLNARGEAVIFMDADGATPLGEIPKLLAKLDEGYPAAIGSRVGQSPGETVVKTSLHRKVIGRVFAAIVNIFGVSGVGDSQCGFKMFRGEIVRPLFSRQKINGFAFDVEILYLMRRSGIEFAEVPVNWFNQEGSKVNLVTDSMKMLWDVLRIKVLHKDFLPQKNGERAMALNRAAR